MTDKAKQRGTVHRQKARKQHDCAECADPILKGQVYIYLNTFDERTRQWSKYLLCAECERVFNCLRVVELDIGEDLPFAAGSLRREFRKYCTQSATVKRSFQKAWAVQQQITLPSDDPSP